MSLPYTQMNQLIPRFMIRIFRQWKLISQHLPLNLLVTPYRKEVPDSIAGQLSRHGVFGDQEEHGRVFSHLVFHACDIVLQGLGGETFGKDHAEAWVGGT
jgi:hypothetical protein